MTSILISAVMIYSHDKGKSADLLATDLLGHLFQKVIGKGKGGRLHSHLILPPAQGHLCFHHS